MVTHHTVDATRVAQQYADAITAEAGVRELWGRRCGDVVELWLLVDPIDEDSELRLYGATAQLYEDFPDLNLRFHLLNPANFLDGTDLNDLVAADAVQVPLRS
jgi:hypothetical protein